MSMNKPASLPSEIEIGLGRGRLGDYLQEMVDAGWDIDIKARYDVYVQDEKGVVIHVDANEMDRDVERSLAVLYVRWKEKQEVDQS